MEKLQKQIHSHFGDIFLFIFITFVVVLNWKSGYFILGNDTYAPEVNPQVSLSRYAQNPAWRSYRGLGVPSDSEQADIVRVSIFAALGTLIPNWALSQLYIFFSFFMAAVGIAGLAKASVAEKASQQTKQIISLVSASIYMTSLVAAWMFASPLYAFLSAFAFLPFLLWRLWCVFDHPKASSYLWLYVAVLIHTISGMVPTTYIVEVGIVGMYLIFLAICRGLSHGWRSSIQPIVMSFLIVIVTQLFWIIPFAGYVKTNAKALTQSYINRNLTPNLIENEVKYSSFWNSPRFYAAWMDATNDDGTKQYPFAQQFLTNKFYIYLSFIPAVLFLIGLGFSVQKIHRRAAFWAGVCCVGWILLTGINPPYGDLYLWLQEHIPLFKQVFRWQSSKLFPMVAIPFAVLGAYAVAELARFFRKTVFKIVFVSCVLGLLFAGSWHYVTGNLINATSFVKIPSEYFSLAIFLQSHDPKGRIYLAPEANTLYFRSYSWGFFGSSLMNYLIPNPVIEKALTTGSMENEGAQSLLDHALNAKNPSMFFSALARYNVRYVLFDGYAARLHNGYFYQTSSAPVSIADNPGLDLIWEKGKLQLYRVEGIEEKSFTQMYGGHDAQRLNTLLASVSDQSSFISNKTEAGIIYPFALHASSVKATDGGVYLSSVYDGIDGIFTGEIPAQSGAFFSVAYDSVRPAVYISPVVPTVSVNGVSIATEDAPKPIKYDLSPSAVFLSFADVPIAISEIGQGIVIDGTSGQNTTLTQWSQPKSDGVISAVSDGSDFRAQAPYDAIMEWSGQISVVSANEVNICLFSDVKKRCINKNHGITIVNSQTVVVRSDEMVNSLDAVTVYIHPVKSGAKPSITDAQIRYYPKIKQTAIRVPSLSLFQSDIQLRKGDTIQVQIPYITSSSSYRIRGTDDRIGPIYHDSNCGQSYADRLIQGKSQDALTFTSVNCSDKVAVTIPVMRQKEDEIGFVYWAGENKRGIPLKLTIAQEKSGYKQYEDILPYESSGALLSYVPFTTDAVNYTLDLFSYGIGKRPSINTLSEVVFQMIPQSWYTIRLVPQMSIGTPKDTVFRSNEAIHPYWRLINADGSKGSGEPVTINGWEQAWIVSEKMNNVSAQFWPTVIVWVGYALTVLIGLCLLLWQVHSWVVRRRT